MSRNLLSKASCIAKVLYNLFLLGNHLLWNCLDVIVIFIILKLYVFCTCIIKIHKYKLYDNTCKNSSYSAEHKTDFLLRPYAHQRRNT